MYIGFHEVSFNLSNMKNTILQLSRPKQHFLFWVLIYVYNTLYLGFLTNAYGYQFVHFGAMLPFILIVAYFNHNILIPQYLLQKKFFLYGILLITSLTIMAFTIQAVLNLLVYANICPIDYFPYGILNAKPVIKRIVEGLTIITLMTGLKLVRNWFKQHETVQRLEKSNLENELQLLKSQIQPHFIFNTLNNIYSLSVLKSDKTPVIIEKLSQLFSYLVYDSNHKDLPIAKEIQLIENYIDLEKIRIGDNMDIQLEVEECIYQYHVPPYLFMPFVENAFKHGNKTDGFKLKLNWEFDSNFIIFTCINNINRLNPLYQSGGSGLGNLRKRLALIYGQQYFLDCVKKDGIYEAVLKIPIHEKSMRDY